MLFEILFREGNGVNISSCAATVKAGTPESLKILRCKVFIFMNMFGVFRVTNPKMRDYFCRQV